MTHPADTKLTPGIVLELCQRAGSKAYIAGSIGGIGTEFVLGLKVVNCQSGDTLAQEQVTAASKEKVLDAVSILRQSRRLYGSRAPQRGPAATQSQNHKLQAAMLMAGALE